MLPNSRSYPLRLCASMREQVTHLARLEGISVNHFISLALAEKISRLQYDNTQKEQSKDYAKKRLPGAPGQVQPTRFY